MTNSRYNNKLNSRQAEEFRGQLLDWYDRNRRTLPWRAKVGENADPYRVWLSEIMLQQTTVNAVAPYFTKFLSFWPDIHALAAAPRDEVMREWAGLGYYARARNLHACAQLVSREYDGRFPEDQKSLKKLPGIGEYTSAAIAAIAFNKPATVVDGNVERVMARYFAVAEPVPKAKPLLKKLAAPFFRDFTTRPGDLAQAFMDLGSAVCTPKSPKCFLCPVRRGCGAALQGQGNAFPVRGPKKPKPRKTGYVYWVSDGDGRVLLQKRPENSMLGGMTGFPTSEWVDAAEKKEPGHPKFLKIGREEDWSSKPDVIHSFTHFDLLLLPRTAEITAASLEEGYFWCLPGEVEGKGLPSLFQKVSALFRE